MTNLNKNITSTPNQFKAFGEAVNVPYRVTLRDYRLASETRPSNYGKGLYNDNLYDLMGVVQNGKLVLSSRWQSEIGPQGGYDLNDTVGIENAIKSWESMVKEKGRILVTDDSSKSKITRKFLVADPPPVDSPKEKTSGDDTGNLFSKFGQTVENTTTVFPNLAEVFKLPDFRTKTVKHPSTFRGITLNMGEKVEVKDLSGVFGSKNGKVYVKLTEKGYIVSSPALKDQYRVNVNSPNSSQVILQLEKTVRKIEKAVVAEIKAKDEAVSKTLSDIGFKQATPLIDVPDYSGSLSN